MEDLSVTSTPRPYQPFGVERKLILFYLKHIQIILNTRFSIYLTYHNLMSELEDLIEIRKALEKLLPVAKPNKKQQLEQLITDCDKLIQSYL